MVTISGVTWRITMVAEGLVGNSCGILNALFRLILDVLDSSEINGGKCLKMGAF